MQLDKDTREAIDGSQALADSAVYSSFALAMAGAAWWTSAALRVVGFHPVQLLGLQSAVDVPNARWAVLIGTMLTCAAYAMYRGALFANAQFGEIFKAVFDVHASRFDHFSRDIMNVDAIIDEVGSTLRDWSIRDLAPRDKLTIAWRYLHNFRVKCPTCGKVIPVPAFRAHVAKEHEP